MAALWTTGRVGFRGLSGAGMVREPRHSTERTGISEVQGKRVGLGLQCAMGRLGAWSTIVRGLDRKIDR